MTPPIVGGDAWSLVILNEKNTSPHQCSFIIVIKCATIVDSGLYKFYSNYGGLISECSLVVNESSSVIGSPDDTNFDWKLAFSIVLPMLAVVLAVVFVFAVKALKQKILKISIQSMR